jgi:hypothetical protein
MAIEEEKVVFIMFFAFLAIAIVLVGSYFLVQALGLPDWIFGLVVACAGINIATWPLFDIAWNDRYFLLSIAILLTGGGFIWAAFVTGAPLILGLTMVVLVFILVGIIFYTYFVGWGAYEKARKHASKIFLLVTILSIGFLLVLAEIILFA